MSVVKVDKVNQYKSNVWYFVTNDKFFIEICQGMNSSLKKTFLGNILKMYNNLQISKSIQPPIFSSLTSNS